MATTTRRTKAAAPVEEPEDEFEDMGDEAEDDLEELEEDEAEAAPKPKAKRTGSNKGIEAARKAREASAPEYGSAWLAAHVTEVTGETYDGRAVRMLLRKLASSGKLDRVVGETRDRYSFSGVDDPIVKIVIKMVTSGEAKQLKQEGLQKVKDQAAAKKAAAAAKKAEAEAAEDDAEEMEDEDVEEPEPPKPTRRRAAAPKPAAPAKATPAKATTTRRRATTSA